MSKSDVTDGNVIHPHAGAPTREGHPNDKPGEEQELTIKNDTIYYN